MSDHIGPEVAAETARRAQRHPYAGHPAALVLADHQPKYVTAVTAPAAAVRCCCGDWDGQWCDFAAHQAEALAVAGLLAASAEERGVLGYVWTDPRTGDQRFFDPRDVTVAYPSVRAAP